MPKCHYRKKNGGRCTANAQPANQAFHQDGNLGRQSVSARRKL